jgi:hypothetical protein
MSLGGFIGLQALFGNLEGLFLERVAFRQTMAEFQEEEFPSMKKSL